MKQQSNKLKNKQLGQSVKTTSVINLLNVVEDKEKKFAASESVEETKLVDNVPTEQSNPAFNIRDFARTNRVVKD